MLFRAYRRFSHGSGKEMMSVTIGKMPTASVGSNNITEARFLLRPIPNHKGFKTRRGL